MPSVLERLSPAELYGGAGLFPAYAQSRDDVLGFFTHRPRDLSAAVPDRAAFPYPRARLARLLELSNTSAGAAEPTLSAISALGDPETLCVVAGQQAGFLGGPLYTAYKIATAIRVAGLLEASTGRRVVPVFWLASEDHDFQEINHTYTLQEAGEVRRISFGWNGAGRPISDLPLTAEVTRALARYCAHLDGSLEGRELARSLAPGPSDSYCSWIARLLLRVFGRHGLVIVEPRFLAPLAGSFFGTSLALADEIRDALREAAASLQKAGFTPALDPEQAGIPFRFSPEGLRLRCPRDASLASDALARPEGYSADAALRPLLQDSLLPTAVSVLGPGEIAYQAMLRPLYGLFRVPQPLLLPRLSRTFLTEPEADLLDRSRLSLRALLAPTFPVLEVLRTAATVEDRDFFRDLRRRVEQALEPAQQRVAAIDPTLTETARRTHEAALRAVGRLEQRSYRALLARSGVSVRGLLSLRSAVLPRGILQERTYPLPFLMLRHGAALTDELVAAGDPLDFRHEVAVAGRP